MKKLRLFAFLFMAAVLGGVLVSCSSDDDGDGDGGSAKGDLVGYWIRYDGDDMEEFGLFEDGTCNYLETWDDGDEMETAEGTYSVNGNKLTLRLTFDDEKETWEFTIKSVKKKKQLVLIDEDGDTYTYDYYKK